jgi:hypothetical protein
VGAPYTAEVADAALKEVDSLMAREPALGFARWFEFWGLSTPVCASPRLFTRIHPTERATQPR